MKRVAPLLPLTCLVSSVALAQPPPHEASEPIENPPPTDQPLIPEESTLPAPVVKEEEKQDAKKFDVGYDGGFFLRSDDGTYALTIMGRFMPYMNYSYVRATKDSQPQFEVRRARLILQGNLHGKDLTFKLQPDFGRGNVNLRDAHFDVRIAGTTWLRFGQWKRPFSRQQINSSGRQQMTNRAITNVAFGPGRDIGVALHNNYERSPEIEWTLGVFNGRGDVPAISGSVMVDPMSGMGTIGPTTVTNVPLEFRPAVIARVGYNTKDLKGYSEADLEGGPLRFGAAASVWLEGDFDDDAVSNQKVQADYTLKAHGFSTTGGVYFLTAQDGDTITKQEASLFGFHTQAGYLFTPRWEAVARYAYINDVTLKSKTPRDQQEISVTANFYAYGHAGKFQGGVRLIKTGAGAFTDVLLFELGTHVAFW